MTAIRLLPAALLLAALGCGDGRPTVYPTRGTVYAAAGKPAAGVLVVFHPTAPPAGTEPVRAAGTTDSAGAFKLSTYDDGDGVPAGEYKVTLLWPLPRRSPFDLPKGDQFEGRYKDPATTPLTATVEAKPDNEVPPIRAK